MLGMKESENVNRTALMATSLATREAIAQAKLLLTEHINPLYKRNDYLVVYEKSYII